MWRPDDGSGDAEVMRGSRAGDRGAVDDLYARFRVDDAVSTTYVLWGLGGNEPEASGAFDVERSQMSLRTVGSGLTGLDDYAQYGISIEPGQKPPSEPTEVVAIGQVTS